MAKSPNQKLKLLYLYQILLQRTDEEHPITVPPADRGTGPAGHPGGAEERLRRSGGPAAVRPGRAEPEGPVPGLVRGPAGV